ncbi:MAG: hypothetical protein HY769_01260 [Candidatus Stahlbacteria bacterium]|nr:hypothetical protein [Candidatus Stahlbacteria bacterium]
MRRKIFGIAVSMLLVASLAEAKKPVEGTKMFELQRAKINQVDMPITNYGTFGKSEAHSSGCYWPKGTGQPYIFGAGIWVGAFVERAGGTVYSFQRNAGYGSLPDTLIGDVLVSCGYNPVGVGCDFIPGPPDSQDIWDQYLNHNSHPENRILFSDSTQDTLLWPIRDSSGNPIFISDEDTWCEYNDLCDSLHRWAPETYPLGIHITQRTFAWDEFWIPGISARDMIFIFYEIKNVSEDTLKNVFIGHAADDDVGYADDDLIGLDIDRSLGWTVSPTQEPGWSAAPPYYVGKKFFQGPTADDTIFVFGTTVNEGPKDTIYPGEGIPLTAFTRCTRMYDATTELKRYQMLAGYNIDNMKYDPFGGAADYNPEDKRMVMGCGPFTMDPGEIDTFYFAVMFSNGNTGGLDYLKRESDLAQLIVNGAHKVEVIAPTIDTIANQYEVKWTAQSVTGNPLTIDLYLTPDYGATWDTLIMGLPNTGTYQWTTTNTVDGFYRLLVYAKDSLTIGSDLSDEFVINNSGNGQPKIQIISPNGGENFYGIKPIQLLCRDPDGDTLLYVNLKYSNNGSDGPFIKIVDNILNTGTYNWNTANFPSGDNCFILAEISDGVLDTFDLSDLRFSVINLHPQNNAQHDSGGCSTTRIYVETIRPDSLTGHEYEVRFKNPDRETIFPYKAIYTYDVYDITLNTPVILGHSFMVSMDKSLCVDYSPMFDGLSLRTEVLIDDSTFSPDSIKVVQGVYADSLGLIADKIFVPNTSDSVYTTLESKKWAFRGEGTIEIRWHKTGDTLRAEVWDIVNNLEIPFDSTLGLGWCFRGTPSIPPFNKPRDWITATKRVNKLYIAGAMYNFNAGSQMTTNGFSSITEGDVWTIYNSGNRASFEGDIYRFKVGGVQEKQIISPRYVLKVSPNPFTKSTTIDIRLETKDLGLKAESSVSGLQSLVSLAIYDLAGRLVKTWDLGIPDLSRVGTGGNCDFHKVVWDGRDAKGKQMSAGIYFCTLKTSGNKEIKKIVFLK